MLAELPSRASSGEDNDASRTAYHIALDGVEAHGLTMGVRAILQGVLQHAFFPSTAELRQQCDKAMQPHREMRAAIHRQEQIRRERPPELVPLSEDAKERQRQRMAAFHASINDGKAAEQAAAIEAERADIRKRYGMTDEVLAGMKDAENPNWKRVGEVKSA